VNASGALKISSKKTYHPTRPANEKPATSCSAPGIGLIAIASYNCLMAWHRILLALAFLAATLLGNATTTSTPLAKMGSGMAMDMHGAGMTEGLMPEKCNLCHKTSDAMLPCMPACAMSAVPLSDVTALNLISDAAAFDYPDDQDFEGAKYPPEPHPPKFSLFS
jgi:hypothetical protein